LNVLLILCLLLQAPPPAAGPAPQGYQPSSGSLGRIKRALEQERGVVFEQQPDRPKVRVWITEEAPELELPWIDRAIRSSFARPSQPPEQYEFLKTVTPEEFRGGVLHPIGIPVVSVVEFFAGKMAGANRARKQRAAKKEVEEALRQFLAETRK
jgi:hypothetical protein